ncbi:hypothetical protein JZ751_021933, partial [Albula glossodonta]
MATGSLLLPAPAQTAPTAAGVRVEKAYIQVFDKYWDTCYELSYNGSVLTCEKSHCQVQLKAEQSDSEHAELPNRRLDEAAWAFLFGEEEEFTSHVAKEKEEEVE